MKLTNYYSQVITYPKRVLYSVPDFDFMVNLIQPLPGIVMTFVHIDVYYMSHKTLQHMMAEWPNVRSRLPPIVYAQGDVTDAKWAKFVKRFGFTYLTDCLCSDGVSRRIFINRHN